MNGRASVVNHIPIHSQRERLASISSGLKNRQSVMQGATTETGAIQDLARRSVLFRNRLLEEFQVLESSNDVDLTSKTAPQYTTHDIAMEPDLFTGVLRETPQQLIKFKMFKRTAEAAQMKPADRRLARVKNINSVPIGVWANWVVNHTVFTTLMILLIFLNGIILGVAVELPEENYKAHTALELMDNIVLISFSVEIALKWLDNFKAFWNDGWNLFDFVITIMSAIPELLLLFIGTDAQSSAQVAKIARQMRVFRTMRSFKMVVRFRSLRIIVRTILEAFQSLGNIMLLLLIIIYIYAIIGINVFEPYTESTRSDLLYQDKFSALHDAFISLFQLLTLDQWYSIYKDYTKIIPGYTTVLFFVTWVWLGAFVFRNIFVGVMVRNFQNIADELTKADDESIKRKHMEKMWKKLQTQLAKNKDTKKVVETDAASSRSSDTVGEMSNVKSSDNDRSNSTSFRSELKPSASFRSRHSDSDARLSDSFRSGESSSPGGSPSGHGGATSSSAVSRRGRKKRSESFRSGKRSKCENSPGASGTMHDGADPFLTPGEKGPELSPAQVSDNVTVLDLSEQEARPKQDAVSLPSATASPATFSGKHLASPIETRARSVSAPTSPGGAETRRLKKRDSSSKLSRSSRHSASKKRKSEANSGDMDSLGKHASFISLDMSQKDDSRHGDDENDGVHDDDDDDDDDDDVVSEGAQLENMVMQMIGELKSRRVETLWPRDTLFKYFQLMEQLQENMKEYQELQLLLAWTLHEINDT
eukprot:Rmarinus@m.27381